MITINFHSYDFKTQQFRATPRTVDVLDPDRSQTILRWMSDGKVTQDGKWSKRVEVETDDGEHAAIELREGTYMVSLMVDRQIKQRVFAENDDELAEIHDEWMSLLKPSRGSANDDRIIVETIKDGKLYREKPSFKSRNPEKRIATLEVKHKGWFQALPQERQDVLLAAKQHVETTGWEVYEPHLFRANAVLDGQSLAKVVVVQRLVRFAKSYTFRASEEAV